MSEYEVPEHMRLYVDVIRVLPVPGQPMTVDSYEKTRDLLVADYKARASSAEPKRDAAAANQAEPEERPKLTAGTHLADSSRAGRTPHPDTTAGFGFGRRYGW